MNWNRRNEDGLGRCRGGAKESEVFSCLSLLSKDEFILAKSLLSSLSQLQ
jgi:hypothetical protein